MGSRRLPTTTSKALTSTTWDDSEIVMYYYENDSPSYGGGSGNTYYGSRSKYYDDDDYAPASYGWTPLSYFLLIFGIIAGICLLIGIAYCIYCCVKKDPPRQAPQGASKFHYIYDII